MRVSLTSLLTTAMVIVSLDVAPATSPPAVTLPHHPYLNLKFVRQRRIGKDDRVDRVAERTVWEFDGNDVAEGKVTTADVYINGRGSADGLELEGKFALTFQQKQVGPVWLYAGTTISLGDTRPELLINEFEQVEP